MDKRCCSHPNHKDRAAAVFCAKCEKCYCSECVSVMHSLYFSDHADFVTEIVMQSTPAPSEPFDPKRCCWKECPESVEEDKRYALDSEGSRVAVKAGANGYWCSVIGNTPFPLGKVTSWGVKVLKSRKNDCSGINIGVAPSDVNQSTNWNTKSNGWYLNCYAATLHSGPPHSIDGTNYGKRKGYGQYVHTGDTVNIVMDTTKAKGELSFVVSGVNLGVAYEGIPLDKPLVPCVLLAWVGDSVELVV